jgi:hypothetical protein
MRMTLSSLPRKITAATVIILFVLHACANEPGELLSVNFGY